jgi:hypothetical protein
MLKVITFAVLLASSVVMAEDRPWAKGVLEVNQTKALELFRDGNAALKESLFVKAAATYRQALTFWDHPAVHYNLALALVNLDQPVETHEHLVKALAYGAAPLDSDKFDQAQRYKSLVEKQLTKIKVTCDLSGASVKLDGQQLFVGPGKYEAMIRSGSHTLLATRDEYLPSEESLKLIGGEEKSIALQLRNRADTIEYRRLFAEWIPWVVAGAGVAVAGAGVGMHLAAKGQFAQYDSAIVGCQDSVTGGCVPGPQVASVKSTGDALQTGAIAAYAVGGAALVTGASLLFVNRLQPYEKSIDVKPTVSVAPILMPGGAGAQVVISLP